MSDYIDERLLEQYRAEIEALRAENERLKEELGYTQIQRDDARYGSQVHQAENERLRAALGESAGGKVDWIVRAEQLQAEVERLRAVVEAARFADNCIDDDDPVSTHNNGPGSCLWDLHKALAALSQT